MKTCPVCQQVLNDQAKFCYFCGASLLSAEQETIVPAPEPVPEPEAEPVPAPEPEPDIILPEIPEEQPTEEPAPDLFEAAVVVPPTEPEPEPAPVFTPDPEPEPAPAPAAAPAPEPAPAAAPEPAPAAEPAAASASTAILATDSRSLMTTAGYIFTTLLFGVPIIGLIFMIVWGCGKTKNLSRKRFSLAMLIIRLVSYIILLAAVVFLLICFSGKFEALYDAVVPILFP